jgi:uncharacterized protein (DUF58 family)
MIVVFKNLALGWRRGLLVALLVLGFGAAARYASAATLSVSPASGTFTVGDTINVSVLLDTQGQTINAVQSSLSFPPDKLQLVSPSTGQSIIQIYTTPPRVNNQTGRVDIAGGIPGGINVKAGLVSTLVFRIKAPGPAAIHFTDQSRALLNDGAGTEALSNTINASYQLVLPPPSGPVVTSETHPDQNTWYDKSTAILD